METNCLALTCTKNILDEFYSVSSLQINSRKTKLCVVGRDAPPDFINLGNELGFEFVDVFKMLGVVFDKNLSLMDRNITNCIRKMNNIRNFFAFFNLTIPGKIHITKSFILLQITYIGSILSVSDEHIETIENLIYNFINQGANVARSKIFSSTQEGGFGLPRIKVFLQSLDCLLFKKSLFVVDTWSTQLRNFATKNDKFYFAKNCNIEENPILHRIIANYSEFAFNFWINHDNAQDMRVFNNPHVVDRLGQKITKQLFTNVTWLRDSDKIVKLKLKHFISEEKKVLPDNLLRQKTNCNFTFMECWHLRSIIKYSIENPDPKLKLFDKIDMSSGFTIQKFLMNKDLRSKDFRVFLLPKQTDIKTRPTTRP